MAPITATTVGISRQTIDDPALLALLDRLRPYDCIGDTSCSTGGGAGTGTDSTSKATNSDTDTTTKVDLDGLVKELERCSQWKFQEMADLYEWIQPLNAMDAALRQMMRDHPALLLIEPSPLSGKGKKEEKANDETEKEPKPQHEHEHEPVTQKQRHAESEAEVKSIPPSILHATITILRFLSTLLRHATHKSLFNSVAELSDLLASSHDDIAALALEVLSNLAMPPMVHRLQSQETTHHTTALHVLGQSTTVVHSRLVVLAKGWGTRGCGLGLATCVTADDSNSNVHSDGISSSGSGSGSGLVCQGSLPRFAGEVKFEFFPDDQDGDGDQNTKMKMEEDANHKEDNHHKGGGGGDGDAVIKVEHNKAVTVTLSMEDICIPSPPPSHQTMIPSESKSDPPLSPSRQLGKRRKMSAGGTAFTTQTTTTSTAPTLADHERDSASASSSVPFRRRTKSTAHLFFQCLEKIGGRSNISNERLFSLLAHIRLAAAFHNQKSRIAAVQRRMHALLAVIYAHPSQDVLAGYFHAQPELCREIADLVRPIVSSSAVSATGTRAHTRTRIGGTRDAEVVSGGGAHLEEKNNADGANANNTNGHVELEEARRQAAISSIVDPSTSTDIPYAIRSTAVEVLTALVARKDEHAAGSGGLSQVSRQTNILGELGVAKGHFLGLLPTLIRYSLASLNAFLSKGRDSANELPLDGALRTKFETIGGTGTSSENSFDIDELGLDLGLTFLEATKAPSFDKQKREEMALEFVEMVLSLASSIVNVATGTAALTDCGLVPALVSTIALTSNMTGGKSAPLFHRNDASESKYCASLLKFITAQAIQILEGAIVTHNPALIAFHDLKATDLLVKLLHSEFKLSFASQDDGNGDVAMDGQEEIDFKQEPVALEGSTRVLLFSILNCLTIVFHHQETNPRSSNAPIAPADVLRRPELTSVLNGIMLHVYKYGGVLGALATTLLSDIMNSDPKVVHYVYDSGLADTLFRMIKGKTFGDSNKSNVLDVRIESWHEPEIPPVPELIMSLPNVVLALSLTEDGRKKVLEVNPIPELLSLMCSAKFSMPHSRCMLNEMASIIGTGLDELMRHVPNIKSTVIKSLVALVERIVYLGTIVTQNEDQRSRNKNDMEIGEPEEDKRISLLHYASNVGQVLEHVLQNEDNCGDFVNAGGVNAILKLHPLLMVRGRELLAHISCQSAPSVANLSHSTSATTFMTAIKRCAVNDCPVKVIKKITQEMESQLDAVAKSCSDLRKNCDHDVLFHDEEDGSLNVSGILEAIPRITLNVAEDSECNDQMLDSYSLFIREVINTEWLSLVMAEVIRVAGQRIPIRNGRMEWLKEVASDDFRLILKRLGTLYRTSMSEVCRIRSEDDFEARDNERWQSPGRSNSHPAIYRLRIVCADGAIVRDGIDIDSCSSVGGLEMGEEVEAFDRCINRSGIMRYRTARGWVSELTRGHGREPISEVLSVSGISSTRKSKLVDEHTSKIRRPVDYGIADLCSVGASILARLHASQSSICSSISRSIMVGFRTRPSASQPIFGPHIGDLVRDVGSFLRKNFQLVQSLENEGESILGARGVAMYLGNALGIFHSCLYEERRDRQLLNVILLCHLLYHDGLYETFLLPLQKDAIKGNDEKMLLPDSGFYGAIRSVMKYSLVDIAQMEAENITNKVKKQRVNKVVASCLPATLSLLRRLSSQSLTVEPEVVAVLGKMKPAELSAFFHDPSDTESFYHDNRFFSFRQNAFARAVHCNISAITHEFWKNPNLKSCPPHILKPLLSFIIEVLSCLQDSMKEESESEHGSNDRSRLHGRIMIPPLPRVPRPFGSIAVPYQENPLPNADTNAGENEPMSENNPKEKELSEAEMKKMAEQNFDKGALSVNKNCFEGLKNDLISVGLNIIEGPSENSPVGRDSPCLETEDIDEANAVTIVVSSFILDISEKYPEERQRIVETTLDRLLSHICVGAKGSQTRVMMGKNRSLSSICHAAVILLRALPQSRISVLKRNLVTHLINCVRGFTSKIRSSGSVSIPSWISPVLLLIEIMSQPMTLTNDSIEQKTSNDEKTDPTGDVKKDTDVSLPETPTKPNRRDEYERVCSDHKKQRTSLVKTSTKISSVLSQIGKCNSKADPVSLAAFTNFPAFAPLITLEAADHCLSICMQLLKLQKRKKCKEKNPIYLSSEITHSTVLLLTRILHFQKVASRCLRMGGAELLLSLHSWSRFKGHVGLVTLALRRMIEDESTLQTAMEIEIRSVVTKILKKQRASETDDQSIPGKAFVQSVTPLICRDPVVFLRAAATSLSVQQEASTVESEQKKIRVSLLSSEVRGRNAKALSDCFRTHNNNGSNYHSDVSMRTPSKSSSATMKQNERTPSNKTPSSKSPHPKSGKKSAKKEKHEKVVSVNGTPASHVTSQLLSEMIKSYQSQKKNLNPNDIPFLCTFEYLEMIGDILLAVPACASAIYSYRLPNSVTRGRNQSRGALGYLLHTLLPQSRENFSENPLEFEAGECHPSIKRREAYGKIRVAQCSARLLVALVARAGEGRHRVISELSSALNGKSEAKNLDETMWALQAWGELCLGLAAPRRNTSSGDSNNSSLSFEVVKVMAEYGMAHSLMNALKQVVLIHPLAAATAASLLRPLEILTRPTVADTLQEMAEKDEKKKKIMPNNVGGGKSETRKASTLVDEGMLEDGFDAESNAAVPEIYDDNYSELSEAAEDTVSEDDEEMISASSEDIDSDSESDSDLSSSSSDSDDVEEEDDGDQIEILEGDHSMSDNENEMEDEDDEQDMQNNPMEMEEEVYEDDFPVEEDNDDFFEGEEEIDEDEVDEEGWTSIDATDPASMLFSSRPGAPPVGRPRAGGGLMIEAAASVLNNILRSGEIQMEALAEIEQTLGIRLPSDMHRIRIRQPQVHPTASGTTSNDANSTAQTHEPIGERPVVHQGNPPENGFSGIGSVGVRHGDPNFMECLYGSPVFGPTRIYYDLQDTPREADEERAQHVLPIPSSIDIQLFPGGPAACTQVRAPHVVHTLIAGVNLGPLNSLLSINRRLEESPRGRRSSDPFGGSFSFTATYSSGGHSYSNNVIRLNRPPSINATGNRGGASWTEGQALGRAASDFSLAFERSLASFVVAPQSQGEVNTESTISANTGRTETQSSNAQQSSSNSNENGDDDMQENRSESSEIQSSTVQDPLIQGDTTMAEPENSTSEINSRENIAEDSLPTENDQNNSEPTGGTVEANETNPEGTTNDLSESNQNDSSVPVASDALECPPGMDPEVFAQLPIEMQREIVEQNDTPAPAPVELDASSNLDPEVLAALPEDVRREVIEQEQNERRMRQQDDATPADPSRAEDMDPASFIASLAPDLREEILLTSDDDFLSQLPPDILAEAQLLRERALLNRHRREVAAAAPTAGRERHGARQPNANEQSGQRRVASTKRRNKSVIRVDCDRTVVTYVPPHSALEATPLVTPDSMKTLLDLMYLLSPVRPQKLLQKLLQNLCSHPDVRKIVAIAFIALLNDDAHCAIQAIASFDGSILIGSKAHFSPCLIGIPPEAADSESLASRSFFRRNRGTSAATAIAMNLPLSALGSASTRSLPPVVARRVIGTLSVLTKNASRLSLDILRNFDIQEKKEKMSSLDTMISLLSKTKYSQSSSNLEDLLGVIENICVPLSSIPTGADSENLPSQKEIDTAAAAGKEYLPVPRATVSPNMLKLLCSILRLESCKDALFAKVSSIARRLCRVEANRKCILEELALVAQILGSDAIRDLRSLRIRLNNAVQTHYGQLHARPDMKISSGTFDNDDSSPMLQAVSGTPSSAVTLSTNNTELKLLRVLQTLHNLCSGPSSEIMKKQDEIPVASKELVRFLEGINLDALWEQLTACLSIVSVLEGVTKLSSDEEEKTEDDDGDDDASGVKGGKKLQNSVAGLLTRFLPTVEAFFVVNACIIEKTDGEEQSAEMCTSVTDIDRLVGGKRLLDFIATNKVLLNALLRSSPALLDKGLKAMVQVPRCTSFLDFDVKRHWFKQQVRKLRSQANRRHGSLRLTIRRQYVFEDAYRQLSMRTADEMRGRLHITFANEEGVDAGGLSREFFGILAKEMFNPNYALFTSTEDGCTFQPNPHSSINRDHLHYFKFVGRIVGKAVADGYLLDAHFTRSLYKHMLGVKPTYQDMEAIDPDYYKNLKMLLEYNLEDIGVDLTFSTVTQWFGRSQTVDLIPNGRNITVTEDKKEKYVGLVCEHRMTTAIEKQIKAYLDGFYELVSPSMISIFTPKELELLISGMPDIDILDLKNNTEYNGYRPADKEIVWFWNIMTTLSKSEKASFLQFVTGSSKVPLNGFSELQGMRGIQKFSIHKAGGSAGALMSAHTCFNSLDLPVYKSEEEMREKLLYAIKEGAGSFQFS